MTAQKKDVKQMIDARGLSCPQPVVLAMNLVKKQAPEGFEILVDNVCAVENLTRFASTKGYQIQTDEQEGGDFLLRMHRT